MNDKIHSVDFAGKDDLEKVKTITDGMMRQLYDLPKLIAQKRKIAYECHIAAGFDPDQALELCKNLSLL